MVSEIDRLMAEFRFMDITIPDIYDRFVVDEGHIVSINFDSTNFSQFPHFPVSLTNFPELRQLSFRYNHFSEIPVEIFSMQNLEFLDLGHNHITNIPSGIQQLTKLTELRLNHNKLDSVSYLPQHIQRLNVSSNQIESCSFNNLPSSLTSLSLTNNRIHQVDDQIATHPLQFLNLRSNHISILPKALFTETNLRLNVYNNPINWPAVTVDQIPRRLFVDHHQENIPDFATVLRPRFRDYRDESSHPPEFGVSYRGVPFTSIMIYGEEGTDKQNLIETYLYQRFIPDTTMFITQNRYLNWDHYLYRLGDVYYQVWYPFTQNPEDPTYRTSVLNGFYYTNAVILMFSYTDPDSFSMVLDSIKRLFEVRQRSCPIIVVANSYKRDTAQLTQEQVKSALHRIEQSNQVQIPLVEVDLMAPKTVDDVFRTLYSMITG